MVKRSTRGAPRGSRRRGTRSQRVYDKPATRRGVRRTSRSGNGRASELRITVVTEPSLGTAARPNLPFMKPAEAPEPPKKARF